MKKQGFTLAELLIVLGVTGVVAAVILPAINGLMPDKTKINYLKVYDELGKNIKSLTADSTLFPVMLKNGDEDIDVSSIPLLNNTQPLKSPFNNDRYSGDKKLCNLIAFSMGVSDSCKDTSYPDKSSFTTANGMDWWISQTKRDINTAESKASYQTDIYVDVDSSKKSSNCMYGETNCKNPDRFKFLLAADGTLIPADPVGLHYINTRKNLLKKKFKPDGEVLANLDNSLLNNDYNTFLDNETNNTIQPETPELPNKENPDDNYTPDDNQQGSNPACKRVLSYHHNLRNLWVEYSSTRSISSDSLYFSYSVETNANVIVVGETTISIPETGIYEIEISPLTYTAEYKDFKDVNIGPFTIPSLETFSYTNTQEAKRFALLPSNIKLFPQLIPFESTADNNLMLVPQVGADGYKTDIALMFIYDNLDNPNVVEERYKVEKSPEIVDIKYIPINSKADADNYLRSHGVKHYTYLEPAKIPQLSNYENCEFQLIK